MLHPRDQLLPDRGLPRHVTQVVLHRVPLAGRVAQLLVHIVQVVQQVVEVVHLSDRHGDRRRDHRAVVAHHDVVARATVDDVLADRERPVHQDRVVVAVVAVVEPDQVMQRVSQIRPPVGDVLGVGHQPLARRQQRGRHRDVRGEDHARVADHHVVARAAGDGIVAAQEMEVPGELRHDLDEGHEIRPVRGV